MAAGLVFSSGSGEADGATGPGGEGVKAEPQAPVHPVLGTFAWKDPGWATFPHPPSPQQLQGGLRGPCQRAWQDSS